MSIERLTAALADRYTIERELGAGGMATVYLARDLKHDRQVAIKVLRPELAAVIGADRFLAEIKTTANLQHPHILSLFDSGTVDGTVFYVMPFVDGESLRDLLVREKQLPVDEATRIAREVADALQYAHTHGVIHRDIKPENILVQGGHALVADFGIALAASKIGGTRMTETGMSLGTPQYMSPEQAMGERELDARTDIYALGCVTYEMLSGEAPFTGPTAQAIVAKVLTEPAPSVRSKRSSVPEHVSAALQVAMQKTPADRFRTAAEFAAALNTATTGIRAAPPAGGVGIRPRLLGLLLTGAVVATVLAFVLGGRVLGARPTAAFALGRAHHVTWDAGLEVMPAISPDGKSVAYATGPMSRPFIMVRPIGEGRPIRLTSDTANGEGVPRWSPDGTRILYLSGGGVFSAPAGGGPSRPEVPGSPDARIGSATWSPDGGRIAFSRRDSLLIREQDGTVHPLARVTDPSLCTWSPTGAAIACGSGNSLYAEDGALFGNVSPSSVVVVGVKDGTIHVVTDSTSLNASPAWDADGRRIFFVSDRDGSRDIYAVKLTAGGQRDGEPARLSAGLGAHSVSTSRDGNHLAYSLYSRRSSIWSVAAGAGTVVSTNATRLTRANEYIEEFAVSNDGKWLYYDSDLTGNSDIFRVATAGGEPEQLTNDPAEDLAPFPSPDNTEFAFHSWRTGKSRELFVQRLDGGGVTRVTDTPLQEGLANWSPDGQSLAFTMMNGSGGVWYVRRDGAGKWGKPVQRVSHGFLPVWSPDGKEISFTTSLRGGSIYIVPVDSGPVRVVLDATRPGTPRSSGAWWASDGLIYSDNIDNPTDQSLWAVDPKSGAIRKVLVLDSAVHVAYRPVFAVTAGRYFFLTEDRQSDVWVMDVKRQ